MPGVVVVGTELPQPFRSAARPRTSRHKVAVPQKTAGLRSCCRAYDHALPNPHAKGFGFPPQTHHREGRALNSGGTQRVREVASPLPDSGDRTNPNRKAVGAAHTPHGGCLPPDPRAVFKFEA